MPSCRRSAWSTITSSAAFAMRNLRRAREVQGPRPKVPDVTVFALSSRAPALVCFENQFDDTVVVCCSETVVVGLHELGTSIRGLLACRVEPDHLSADFGHAHVQIASSDDHAKLVLHRGG